MINNVYICPSNSSSEKDKETIKKSIMHDRFRLIFDINLNIINMDSMKDYFKLFETNKEIIKKLEETILILNGVNAVKKQMLKSFIGMVKKERPVKII